jgi:exonuclease VII large subunit
MAWLSQQDVQDYGSDLVNFSQRAAMEAVAPHLQDLAQQNIELQRRLAAEARHRLDQQVERAIPNYRTLDQHPDWHRWLLGIDELSGRIRQNLLDEAKASGDAARCIAFFRSFFTRGHSQPASGGGASLPSGKIYTRGEIAKIYEQHRRGAYRGREAAWAAQERDIIAASKEGRVAMTPYVTK